MGDAASFSRPGLIEMFDAIHDTVYALFLAPMPNAPLFSKPAPRLNEEFLLQGRGVKLLPVCSDWNADDKLGLVLVPFIEAPKLTAC